MIVRSERTKRWLLQLIDLSPNQWRALIGVLRDRRIEQQASPAELIRAGGYFSDLMWAEGLSRESS